MAASDVLLQSAYLLHLRAYRNTSALIEVFSAEHGRVCLVARGVRKNRSRLQGLLQPFNPLLLSWRGRGELVTLHSAELNGGIHQLKGVALLSGLYLNEMLLYLLARFDPHPELYGYYFQALIELEKAEDQPAIESALRYFEKHLLQELGYGLILDHDVVSNLPIKADCLYQYRLGQGPVLYEGSLPSDQHSKLYLQGDTLLSFDQGTLVGSTSFQEVKRLMRAAISEQLGGKTLNSRKLFKAYK